MSKPANSAARNAMSEFERQCYDWGWEDAEENIIKLLEEDAGECIQTKPASEHVDDYCNCRLIALIKGDAE